MASTPAHFVMRSSKLYTTSSSFSIAQLGSKQLYRKSTYTLRTDPSPFSRCTLSRQRNFTTKQHHSAFVLACTTHPAKHTLNSQIRSFSTRSLEIFRKPRPSSVGSSQRRLASGAGLDPEEKKTGPLSSTKIAAPQILQKALNAQPHENIYTIPNILTFSRLLAAPAIGYFILHSQPVTALALFAYAGFTDLIDGFLARRFNSQTVVGTILDPMADKILMTTAVVCLGIQGLIPVWLAVIILGRDVGLAISACYYRYISLPPPKTFVRYWDFSLPSAEVRPTEISKINTLLQLLLVGNAMVLPVLPAAWVDAWNLLGVFEGWQFLVASTTVWSGLSYVFSNDAVKILSQQDGKKNNDDVGKKV